MKDVMVDLESMGVGNNPALIQIAAVQFDINTGKIGNIFDMKIDLQSSLDAGLEISAGTIKFWMTNPTVNQETRNIVMSQTGDHSGGGNSLQYVCQMFATWCKENEVKYVWGNGTASDNVWLRSAFKAAKVDCPELSFRNDICLRTLRSLATRTGWKQDDIVFKGNEHDGLDDSKYQIAVLTSILNHLNIKELT